MSEYECENCGSTDSADHYDWCPKADQIKAAARTVLTEHRIECTGPGEVTCRACRDRHWMRWSQLWQTYVALTLEGFSEQQALIVIGQILSANCGQQ